MIRRFFYFAATIALFFSLTAQCSAVCDSSRYECVNKQISESHDNGCSDDLFLYWSEPCEWDSQGQITGCCSRSRLAQECFDWEQCSSGEAKCQCCGNCFGVPQSPRYYDNPTYSDQPDKSQNPQNINLPLKLDWDDVIGWKDGWTQNGTKQSCSRNCAKSYRLTIYDTKAKKEIVNKVLTKSEYNIREDKGACFLKPGQTYEWHVSACCDSNGTTCGPASRWSFTTSPAPELESPYDPDWAGPGKIENLELPVSLKWCDKTETNSYYARFYYTKNNIEECHPYFVVQNECVSCPFNQLTQANPGERILYDYNQKFFTKSSEYGWEISACKSYANSECDSYGQKWSFSTKDTSLSPTEGFSPPDDKNGLIPTTIPVIFNWGTTMGANSYIFVLNPGGKEKVILNSGFQIDSPEVQLNSSYSWKVKPCWDFEGKDCEAFGQTYYFKTTGLPPANININAAIMPVNIGWESVSGAVSYYYQLASDSGFQNIIEEKSIEQNSAVFSYPKIKQETDYWFRLKTCAHPYGEICGNWSQIKTFKTFKITPPANISPKEGAVLLTGQNQTLSWDPVPAAAAYKYSLQYTSISSEEKNEKCPALLNQPKEKIIASTNAVEVMDCKGEYQLKVQACMDDNCNAELVGGWSAEKFSVASEAAPKNVQGKGFIPCGLSYDDPTTPDWDESQRCEIKHLFILLSMIINFLMWTLVPIVLFLLIIASGLIFYFSMGREDPLPRVKTLWKAAGIGFGIIFLAWLLVNIGLSLVGFKFGAFGKWWNF